MSKHKELPSLVDGDRGGCKEGAGSGVPLSLHIGRPGCAHLASAHAFFLAIEYTYQN